MTSRGEQPRFLPLNQSTPSIRLIEIHHSHVTAIPCSFHTFELSQCPPYTALSYTWGLSVDAEFPLVYETQWSVRQRLLRTLRSLYARFASRHSLPTNHRLVSISLNGRNIPVRENLYHAMIAVRNRMDHRGVASTLIWVDALCINQEDPVERSHQVNLMSDIYSQAQLVVVWLGPEAENSGLAMRYIEKVSKSMRSYASTKRDAHTNDITNLSETPQSLPKGQSPSHFADSKLASEWRLDKTLCDAISALCDRAYWSRLWVLQEIVLASNILVLCGPETCKWKAFEVLADVEEREKLPDIFDLPAIRTIERRVAWHREGKPAKTLDYLLLYGSPERSQCAEPRDKVFGLLGLLEHSSRAMLGVLEADYAKSATEIFCDILCYMKDKLEWIDPPGEAITGIGRAGVARTIMGVLMLLLGLEDEHAEGTRALIAESFPIARTTYSSTL